MSQQTVRSDDATLGELFKDFYVVPSYQREYVWGADNVEQLMNDVTDEWEESTRDTASEYFLGSIVVCARTEQVFELIDGQQRMTTCYLVLCAIRDRLKQLEPARNYETLKGQIASTSTDEVTGEDQFRYRVELQYEDSGDVLRRIAAEDHGTRSEATVSLRNIWGAYDTLTAFLHDRFGENAAELRRFYAYFTSRVKFVRVRTVSVSHALRVFETINDRGVGLDAMDLLKNLMFIHAKASDFEKLKTGWKRLVDTLHAIKEKPLRFLRYYIFADYGVDRLHEEGIYKWFVDNEAKCSYRAQPLAFVEGLNVAAAAYAHFMAGHDAHGVPNRHLANIRYMSGTARQYLVVLLAARAVPRECFDELVRQVENISFAYVICHEQAKELERLFAQTASEVRCVGSLDALRVVLEKRFAPEKTKLAARFALAFSTLKEDDLQKYRMRYVLAKLTQYINEQAWGSTAPHDQLVTYINAKVEVEHILPLVPSKQALDAFDKPGEVVKHVHRLGNLALLEKTINASIGNGPLAQKKSAYVHSSFLLTKAVAEKPVVGKNTAFDKAVRLLAPSDTWTSGAIEKRQEFLKALAHRIWEIPLLTAEEATL